MKLEQCLRVFANPGETMDAYLARKKWNTACVIYVPIQDTLLWHEIYLWMVQNCRSDYEYRYTGHFAFENEVEALMFKLRFDGL